VSELLQAAQYYLSRGWMPVYVPPGVKGPNQHGWEKFRFTEADLPAQFNRPGNIGVILGEASNGLADVDLDCPEALEVADEYLPATPSVTGRPSAQRSHRWYVSDVAATKQFRDPKTRKMIVELRSNGGQTLVGPSRHAETGEPYDHLDGEPAHVPGDVLLKAVQGIYEAVLHRRYGEIPQKRTPSPLPTSPHAPDADSIERRALAYLQAMPPAVSGQGGHSATYSAATVLVHGFGLSSEHALNLLLAHYNPRCQPPWTEKELRHKAEDAAKKPHDRPRGWLRDQVPANQETGDVDISRLLPKPPNAVVKRSDGPTDPGAFPDDLLDCGGLLKEIVEYNNLTSFKRQPVLALAAGVALVGVVTGRKVRDPMDTRTNIYCLGICRSGGGKERARQVNKEILFRADLQKLVGPEGVASHAGLVNAVNAQPALLFQLDEIGRLIRTLSNPNRAPHLYHVATVLMKFYTSANSIYLGDAYADVKRNTSIDQPHACVYGTTVPQSFYEGLTKETLTDGFLSRMLVFEPNDHDPEPQEPALAPIPDSIVEAVKYWGAFRPGSVLDNEHPKPAVIEYTEEAKRVMQDLETQARRERTGKNETIATLWTRTTEKARKLALIHACSASPQAPRVDGVSAEWAARLSAFLTRKMIFTAWEWVSENPYEANRKRVLREIRASQDGLTKTELLRRTKYLQRKDRDEIVQSLIETGEIRPVTEETGGAPKTVYVVV